MKATELRSKSAEELKQELLSLQEEQFKLRMQKNMGESPRPHLFRVARRGIARIKTLLQEKERQS